MGTLRDYSCYTAPCKTFADGEQDNFIRWYFVPDDRPFYELPHVFPPRVDDCYEATGLEYELTGLNPNPRKHYSGRDYFKRAGDTVDGDPSDFMGNCPASKYEINGYPPPIPCLEPEHVFAEVGLSARRFTPPVPQDFVLAGLRVGFFTYPDVMESGVMGIALGAAGTDVAPPLEVISPRLAVGSQNANVLPLVEESYPGLALGGVEEFVGAVELKMGQLAFGYHPTHYEYANLCSCSTVTSVAISSYYLVLTEVCCCSSFLQTAWFAPTEVCACSTMEAASAFPIADVCACSTMEAASAFPVAEMCACSTVSSTHTP